MQLDDDTFATFACKHSEKQPLADETVLRAALHPVCPERKPARARPRQRPAFRIFDPEMSGGLFLDLGLSRLKMDLNRNCGRVSTVGSSPPFALFPQILAQSVGGLVSSLKVSHAIFSSAVHRP